MRHLIEQVSELPEIFQAVSSQIGKRKFAMIKSGENSGDLSPSIWQFCTSYQFFIRRDSLDEY
jgi:hypothetical protein